MDTLKTSTKMTMILAESSLLPSGIGFTAGSSDLAQWVGSLGLSQWQLLVILTLVFVFLGCILDGISMIVLTMAVLLPVVQAAQLDLLWFGIYLILVVEMAQITPPIGLNLFVLQGLTKRDVGFIAKASFPFFVILCLMLVLIYLFPELVFWLPNHI